MSKKDRAPKARPGDSKELQRNVASRAANPKGKGVKTTPKTTPVPGPKGKGKKG